MSRGELAALLLDETRLAVVAVLAEGCRRFVELHRLLGVSKGSLHHHLRVLEEACVVRRSYRLSPVDRPALYVCLTPEARRELPAALDALIERLRGVRERLEEGGGG